MNQVVCIAGPTASGKSAFAIKLAQKADGEIINADALQVYKDLRVLSARPDEAEMAQVPHHMFGHVDAAERYSTGHWLREVQGVILDVLARGKVPIVIGGTGLYFKALTDGLAQVPQPSEEAIAETQEIYDNHGVEGLRRAAEQADPIAFSRVLGGDPQRLFRIVAVALGTSAPLTVWQRRTRPIIPKPYWRGLVLLPNRIQLYDRINARFDDMAHNGGFDEARHMMRRELDPMLPAMKAIGLRELIAVEQGEISLEEGLETAKRATRRFAKRQYTWFRGQASGWPTEAGQHNPDELAASLIKHPA